MKEVGHVIDARKKEMDPDIVSSIEILDSFIGNDRTISHKGLKIPRGSFDGFGLKMVHFFWYGVFHVNGRKGTFNLMFLRQTDLSRQIK